MSSTILSTKKLGASQQELLLNAGLGFVHYNAIETRCLDFEIPNTPRYYIFTSQNAVRCFLKQYPFAEKCTTFCVGPKTSQYLREHGFEVLECAENAESLAQIISKNYAQHSFLFLCGSLRRDELPQVLKESNVRYKELHVYDTVLLTTKFKRHFDGVLFFSPSAVQSYVTQNDLENSTAFCIGETTAREAKKNTANVIVASKPTVENVLVQSITAFRSGNLGFKKTQK